MMVMTAKVNMKKILLGLAAAAAVILGLILLLGGGEDDTPTVANGLSSNDARVKFLEEMGWEVSTSPVESGQVKIPAEQSEVFDRYQALQKSQGYDLSPFAGKTVMRYVYKVNNYPGATDPVYATLLVHKDQIIGGDITDTSARGKVLPLKRLSSAAPTESSSPSETTAPQTSDTAAGTA